MQSEREQEEGEEETGSSTMYEKRTKKENRHGHNVQ